MNWADITTVPRIRCKAVVAGKREAIALLCDVVAQDLGVEAGRLRDVITAREKLGATTIGKGVLLPHAVSDAVTAPTGALVTLAAPLECNAPDDLRVDLILCVLLPPETKGVPLLAKLMQPLRREATLQALRSATTPDQAWAILNDT